MRVTIWKMAFPRVPIVVLVVLIKLIFLVDSTVTDHCYMSTQLQTKPCQDRFVLLAEIFKRCHLNISANVKVRYSRCRKSERTVKECAMAVESFSFNAMSYALLFCYFVATLKLTLDLLIFVRFART